MICDNGQLEAMSRTNVEEADRDRLADILDINIDTASPAPLRLLEYLRQIKNPYCFMCGKVPVKISFSEDGDALETLLIEHFANLK